jgi:hypothetical protein
MNSSVEHSDFHALVAAIERSPILASDLSTAALAQVRDGVITGEGPTTQGRVHFSRSLDAQDAALCARILMAAGGEAGAPVSRAEAEILLDIDAAAAERADGGRFDDLLAKAVAHHVLAASGRPVPPRARALSPSMALADWAAPQVDIDTEILEWIAGHARRKKRGTALMSIVTALAGAAVAASLALSIASLVDLTA